MRKRLSLLAVGLLATGVVTAGASPAYACDEITTGEDPVYNFVCATIHAVPEPGPTIDHYSNVVFSTVHAVYCRVSPSC